jgi:hydroxymethylpyrimidine kinase/phosphomethylpyrimidine kinase
MTNLESIPPTILTIAGSDPSGGAGIQADLKTIEAHAGYGTSVITALTAQNTKGVSGVWEVSTEAVEKQVSPVHNRHVSEVFGFETGVG